MRDKSILVTFALALLLPACREAPPPAEPVIRPVRTVQVFSTGGARIRSFSGTAQAGQESRLSFRVGGTVDRVTVTVGDSVRAGQLIAELDADDYRLQVQEADASLEQAKAELRNAEANYSRVRALYENRNASRNDLDGARAAAESARARVRSIEKRLELSRSQLSYTRLVTVTDGAIADLRIEENENVQAGQTVVLLTAGALSEVKVAVPEILITRIREGDAVSVAFDSIPSKTFSARVEEVGVSTTGLSTTYPVTVLLDEEETQIRPGMAAEVSFQFESRDSRDRFLLPSVAVGEDRDGRFVFVVDAGEEGIAFTRRRSVVPGALTEEGMEILEGLSDGDHVVIAGVSRIVDGQKVRLLQ